MEKQSGQSPQPTRSLKQFNIVVGDWDMVGTHPLFASPAHGRSSFTWLKEDALLVWRFEWDPPGPPSAISVIGHDDAVESCSMLYADERGVARIYHMSLEDGVWTMSRDAPGFSQRMTSTFSDDGNTITSHGELSRDGSTWEPDLNVIYIRRQ